MWGPGHVVLVFRALRVLGCWGVGNWGSVGNQVEGIDLEKTFMVILCLGMESRVQGLRFRA